MKYLILKYVYWLRLFGPRGLFYILNRNSNTDEIIQLHWKGRGVKLRNSLADLEAVNTVLAFNAYETNNALMDMKTFIDLGANIGIASLYLKRHHPSAKIVAVEPAIKNNFLYEENLRDEITNGTVTLHRAAVGIKNGRGNLLDPGNHRYDSYRIDASNDGDIVIIGIKKLVAACEEPIAVKIDIEGHEIDLLESRSEWINHVCYIMIEFHSEADEVKWVGIMSSEGWKSAKQFDTWHFSKV